MGRGRRGGEEGSGAVESYARKRKRRPSCSGFVKAFTTTRPKQGTYDNPKMETRLLYKYFC